MSLMSLLTGEFWPTAGTIFCQWIVLAMLIKTLMSQLGSRDPNYPLLARFLVVMAVTVVFVGSGAINYPIGFLLSHITAK